MRCELELVDHDDVRVRLTAYEGCHFCRSRNKKEFLDGRETRPLGGGKWELGEIGCFAFSPLLKSDAAWIIFIPFLCHQGRRMYRVMIFQKGP